MTSSNPSPSEWAHESDKPVEDEKIQTANRWGMTDMPAKRPPPKAPRRLTRGIAAPTQGD